MLAEARARDGVPRSRRSAPLGDPVVSDGSATGCGPGGGWAAAHVPAPRPRRRSRRTTFTSRGLGTVVAARKEGIVRLAISRPVDHTEGPPLTACAPLRGSSGDRHRLSLARTTPARRAPLDWGSHRPEVRGGSRSRRRGLDGRDLPLDETRAGGDRHRRRRRRTTPTSPPGLAPHIRPPEYTYRRRRSTRASAPSSARTGSADEAPGAHRSSRTLRPRASGSRMRHSANRRPVRVDLSHEARRTSGCSTPLTRAHGDHGQG